MPWHASVLQPTGSHPPHTVLTVHQHPTGRRIVEASVIAPAGRVATSREKGVGGVPKSLTCGEQELTIVGILYSGFQQKIGDCMHPKISHCLKHTRPCAKVQ